MLWKKNQLSKGRMEELKRVQGTELSFISYQKDIPQEQICYLILFSKISARYKYFAPAT